MDNSKFKVLGILLRLPFYCMAVGAWTCFVFPFVLGFTLSVVIVGFGLSPLWFAVDYAMAAFSGNKEPPSFDKYRTLPRTCFPWLLTGYRGLVHWLIGEQAP